MDDKLLRLARKIKVIENDLNKITQIKDLEGLLFVNTEITNKYKKAINDVVNTYKDYISKTQKELSDSMKTIKKETKEKDTKDKMMINDLDNKIIKIREDIKNICVGIDKSIEEIQKDILNDIKIKNDKILLNLKTKDREISQVKKENAIINNSIVNLKNMLNKLELQKGDTGKSAYELACELGFKGTVEEWIKSLHGKDGKDIELRGMRSFSDVPKDGKSYIRKDKKWIEANFANKIPIIESTTTTLEIQPNKFYKFGEVTELNLTLAEITDNTQLNEYMFEFVSGTTATTLTLPDTIKWLETPTIESNKIYQCSIVNNIGILVGVANV